MQGDASGDTLRDRITRQGEDALGRLAQDLLESPLITGAISRAFEARERAVSAQETAMSALNLPSAADLERLTRRLRSVSQRLEGIEDALDRLEERTAVASQESAGDGVHEKLEEMARDLAALREAVAPAADPVPRAQERLTVTEPA